MLRLSLSQDEKYRLWIPLKEFSPYSLKAALLREDRWFYWHAGVNPVSLVRAAWQSFVVRSRRLGGSTITMQLARIRYRSRTRTIAGKLAQILRAVQLEWHYSKAEILEAYLNLVPMGGNIEGVGAASLIYFRKKPGRLDLAEALALAVVPQRPDMLSERPVDGTKPPEAFRAGSLVLSAEPSDPALSDRKRLHRERNALFRKWIAKHPRDESLRRGMDLPPQFLSTREIPFEAPHFLDGLLQAGPSGSSVATTIDSKLQALVQRHLKNYIGRQERYGVRNAAAMLADFKTMDVLAVAGSADFFNPAIQGQVDGSRALRSPGSTLKPFLYGLAVDDGLIHSRSLLKDTPMSFAAFNPENFDGDFVGPISAQDALNRSRNIPALALGAQLGSLRFYSFLKEAGVGPLREPSFYGLAGLVLGGVEMSMEQLVPLYAMLANGGVFKPLRKTSDGAPGEGKRLLSPEAAAMVLNMLKETPPIDFESGIPGLHRTAEVSWKTGTSYGFRDAWAAGIFGRYVLAVWVGNFDGTGNPAFVGRTLAAPLLFEIVNEIVLRDPAARIQDTAIPPGLIKTDVCSVSGFLRGPHCPQSAAAWFIPGKSPIKSCDIHRIVTLDVKSGLRVPPGATAGGREEVYEFWSSDLLQLFRRAGIPRRVAPPYDPRYSLETIAFRGTPPKITSPLNRVIYGLNTRSKIGDKIPLQAVADADIRDLYWFVDERFVGKSPVDKPLFWAPQTGRFIVRVVDDQGKADSLEVRVTAVH